ncbi:hypothetical protein L3X38_002069 [Prunus dulcis]|uniref:DUF4218 domain-containing protein n=1 Tax=Prunus dulcis TaxID=3755 RepID=A0AAD4WV95_PRUDU|nr:hypothetical protein L3X38_002069 [Prunus dulcis]
MDKSWMHADRRSKAYELQIIDVFKLDKFEEDVVVTLSLLQKYIPPSFFDIMVHLVVHLVREVRLCGPVYFRWMYPFERYMKALKGNVQNRTHPEGCIQEIWDLDYQKFRIPVFICDWIDNTSGLVIDELGFTIVDLSKIGHRNDQFVVASQVIQVFFVDDPMHHNWSVVLSMTNREYNDVIGDDVLGDIRIECEPFTRGIPNIDTFDDLVGSKIGVLYLTTPNATRDEEKAIKKYGC